MSTDKDDIKSAIVKAVEMMFGAGIMQHSGHSNISVRLDENRMLLTSQGKVKGLTAKGIATVTFDGRVLAGEISSTTAEIVSMHAAVYRSKEKVNCVIHNHAPNLTAFALAHEPLPCAYEALLRFGAPRQIPCAQWAPRGSDESVRNIVDQIKYSPHTPAVLLANHGLLAFGQDPLQVVQIIAVLEEAAEATLKARILGGEKPFPADALEQERARMNR